MTDEIADPSRLVSEITAAVEQREGRTKGGETRFLCPAHDDHHPSARWNPTKGVWHCDVCDAGGGTIDLARRLGLDCDSPARGLTLQEVAGAGDEQDGEDGLKQDRDDLRQYERSPSERMG